MEIIICKAKSINTQEWVYGYPVQYSIGVLVLFDATAQQIPIIPETLCYSTQQKDKNGKELFFDDIVNDFGGGVRVTDYDHSSYNPRQAFPVTKVMGDPTRLGAIIKQDGTTRIKTLAMDYAYNLSNAAKLSNMEYVQNPWDTIYPLL